MFFMKERLKKRPTDFCSWSLFDRELIYRLDIQLFEFPFL